MTEDLEKQELQSLIEAAEKGDAGAQGRLGTLYAAGQGVPQDMDLALTWLKRAAEKGDVDSIFNLGVIYEQGMGVAPDLEEAGFWYWQAAERGDSGAKMKLGTMLIKGFGFGPDSSVVKAITASAEGGVAYAQAFLGKLYMEGAGVVADDALAERWFRMAAGQGDESSAFNLAEMMMEGKTTETSEDELAQWFYSLGTGFLKAADTVKAFDCLVSIKRIAPDHFLAQRLEGDIERQNLSRMQRD
ncbi:MAG: sel1 repeat family protein [bacterium]|nr:MAG: sel1 repeat family protein [bacterium]